MFSKGNMNKLMKQAKEMQNKMLQTQKEIETADLKQKQAVFCLKL